MFAKNEYNVDNIKRLWRHLLNKMKTLTRPERVLGLAGTYCSPVGCKAFRLNLKIARNAGLAGTNRTRVSDIAQLLHSCMNKNSSGDEIANVNFYAVRPEGTRIR